MWASNAKFSFPFWSKALWSWTFRYCHGHIRIWSGKCWGIHQKKLNIWIFRDHKLDQDFIWSFHHIGNFVLKKSMNYTALIIKNTTILLKIFLKFLNWFLLPFFCGRSCGGWMCSVCARISMGTCMEY
jgi:hypothetical protein